MASGGPGAVGECLGPLLAPAERQRPLRAMVRLVCWAALVLGCAGLWANALRAEPPTAPPTGDDWPQWGGRPERNMVAPAAHDLPVAWEVSARGTAAGNVRWSAALGTFAYGNPVVAGGRVFVGTNNEQPRDPLVSGDRGVLMCFRQTDGAFLWQDSYEKLPAGDAQDWKLQGICSSPAVAGERVYYVTNRGQVVCADVAGFADGANDGPVQDEASTAEQAADIVWRFDMIAELGVQPHFMTSTNPLVVDGRVFVLTSNGVDQAGESLPAPQAPSVIALDAASGQLVWQEASASGPHSVRMETILDGQWGSLAHGAVTSADGRMVAQLFFPGGDGWLYALDPATGRLIWKFDCNPPGAVWKPGGRGDKNYLVATPVFAAGRVLIAVGQDPEHGGGAGRLVCVDPTGQGDVTATHLAWQAAGKQFGRSISTVAVHDGIVYAAELDGFLRALDLADGCELWQYDALASVWGSPLVADGKVYLADEDGEVAVLRAGRTLEVLAENALGEPSYATPVAVGRTLWVATRRELFALEAPGSTP